MNLLNKGFYIFTVSFILSGYCFFVIKAENKLVSFNISRIDTTSGIFRGTGFWCPQSCALAELRVETLDILGTDGWQPLALDIPRIRDVVWDLRPELLAHLVAKEQVRRESSQT